MPNPASAPVPIPGVVAMGTLSAPESPSGTIFKSQVYAIASSPFNSPEMDNAAWKGVKLFVNTTAVGGAGTVTVKIQSKDPTSGVWVDVPLATTPAIATNTNTTLLVYPGVLETVGENEIAASIGRPWRVVMTIGGNDVTCSVGGIYLA